MLRLPECRAFNLDKNGDDWKQQDFPEDVRWKWRQSEDMFIVRISDYGLECFRKNPRVILADATHKSNKHNFTLTTCHSYNERQEARVVFSVLSPTECERAYEVGFSCLQGQAKTSFDKIKHIISDLAHSPVLGYEKVAQKPIEYWTPCQWHFQQAMIRNLSKSSDQYKEIMEMQRERRPIWFDWRLRVHSRRYGKDSYFQVNYGYNGKVAQPHQWAKCFNYTHPGTSMACEAYHRGACQMKTCHLNKVRPAALGQSSRLCVYFVRSSSCNLFLSWQHSSYSFSPPASGTAKNTFNKTLGLTYCRTLY